MYVKSTVIVFDRVVGSFQWRDDRAAGANRNHEREGRLCQRPCVFTSLPPVTSYLRTNNVNTNTKCSQNTNTDSVKDLCDILSEN